MPIHDEAKITAYYHPSGRPSATKILDHAKSLGLAGALITSGDGRKCIEDIKASSFGGIVFLSSQLAAEEDTQHIGANVCFDLDAYENANDKVAFEKKMSGIQGIATRQTSIGLFAKKYFSDEVDPVLTASATASLMDNTGGGDYILLSPEVFDSDDSCADAMVQLCEELSYLDVEGATIKSRLLVSAMTDDQLEECLMMGISKYIVADETGLDMLRSIVEEQGKQLIR